MLIVGFILLGIAFIFVIIFVGDCKEQDNDAIAHAIIGAIIFMCAVGGILCLLEYIEPTISPMDVYQGKTTLEITYKDSIAIDSTVVWKEEIK